MWDSGGVTFEQQQEGRGLFMGKLSKKLLYVIVISFFFSANAFSQIRVQEDMSIITYQVSGNRSQSFYPKNQTRYLYESKIDFENTLNKNTFYGNIFYRSTDDTLVDPQSFSIEQMYFGCKNDKMDFIMGDYYAYFSDYSLNNSLKGIKLETKKELFNTSILAGIDTSRWEDLWEERNSDSATRRYVWGLNFNNLLFDKKLKVGINYAGARDDQAYFQDTDIYKDIQVCSLNLNYNLSNAVLVNAEIAESYRKADTSDLNLDPKWDNAYKASLGLAKEKYNMYLEYQKVGPHFETTSGFSSQDLESFRTDNSFQIAKNINLFLYFYTERDNLSNLKETTSKRINPGFRIQWSLKEDLNFNMGWDNLKEYTTDETTKATTRTISFGFLKSFKKFSTSGDYSFIKIDDKADTSQKRKKHNISLGLNGNINLNKVDLGWNLSEYIDLERVISVDDDNIVLTFSAGLNLRFLDRFNLDTQISITDNDYYTNENDSNIYHYAFSLSYLVKDNLDISINYEQDDNYYTDENNDYSERKIEIKLSYRF